MLLVFIGSKLNLPCFMFNSLEKIVIAVHSTIRNRDHNMFNHGLIKMLVQYQLSLIGKKWDQFRVDNGFVPTEYWPHVVFASRQKRRKFNIIEALLRPENSQVTTVRDSP